MKVLPLREDPTVEGFCHLKKKQGVTKAVSLSEMAKNHGNIPIHLNVREIFRRFMMYFIYTDQNSCYPRCPLAPDG